MSEKSPIKAVDEKRLVLPIDIRQKRVFWALSAFFILLLCVALVLLVMLLNAVNPPGFGGGARAQSANFRTSFYGPPELLFNRPSDIALSPSGEIYVADTNNARVVVMSQSGNFIREITELNQPIAAGQTDNNESDSTGENAQQTGRDYAVPIELNPERFYAPTSLAFASDGRWFAIDQAMHMILFFDASDQFKQGILMEEESPISVDVNRVGDQELLYVTTRSGILQASLEGVFSHLVIDWGFMPGQFDNPAAVVVSDPNGLDEGVSIATTDTATLTIVADTLNNRVQAFRNFDISPELAWVYGSPILDPMSAQGFDLGFYNTVQGFVSAPVDLALSPLGRVFVLDGLSSEIIVLNARTGEYEYTIASVGSRDGLLYYPSGIDYLNGELLVADSFNDRVSVFIDAKPAPIVEELAAPAEAPNRWLLILIPIVALVLVLARLFSLRMPKYVLDLSALESLSTDEGTLFFIIEHFNKLYLVSGTESVAEKVLPGYFWKQETAQQTKRDDIIAAYPNLEELQAEAIAVTAKRKRRSYLLTASRSVEKSAEELGVKVVRYAEFRAIAHAMVKEDRAEGLKSETQKAAEKNQDSISKDTKKEATSKKDTSSNKKDALNVDSSSKKEATSKKDKVSKKDDTHVEKISKKPAEKD